MSKLKPISKDSIQKALTRAKHYRLLNEPWDAASICRDILVVEPEHQTAILYLILAITDQFGLERRSSDAEAKQLCLELTNTYEQKYYRGIIEERLGKEALKRRSPRVKYIAYEHYRSAMHYFDEAEKLRPKGNEDALLRWNACARSIKEFGLVSSPKDTGVQPFLDT